MPNEAVSRCLDLAPRFHQLLLDGQDQTVLTSFMALSKAEAMFVVARVCFHARDNAAWGKLMVLLEGHVVQSWAQEQRALATKRRPRPNLLVAGQRCKGLIDNAHPNCEGWCNQATWTFSLYLLQEREIYEALCNEIKQARYHPASGCYYSCLRLVTAAYDAGKMEQMDDDYAGEPINLREIIDHLASEIRPTEPKAPATTA